MRTTLICAPPGADASAFLEALAKESDDFSDILCSHASASTPGHPLPYALLEALRDDLRRRPEGSSVALDPWNGLHLAELRAAFDVPPRLVLVLSEPLAAAGRLAATTGCSLVHALASYERHLRHALVGAAGLEVTVVLEGDAPASVVSPLTAPLPPGAPRAREDAGSWLPAELDQLLSAAASLRGHHVELAVPALPTESQWTTGLLGLEDDLAATTAALTFAAEQLAVVLESGPEETGTIESQAEEDQFREPDEGGPYRLNASEDRRAYHRWLTWKREPSIVGGAGDAPLRKAATRASRRSPLISVIVPVYRPPLWALERCVGSVLAQRFADWELRLCDDASGDPELTAYLRSLPRLDRRITVVESEQNGGIAAARNRAMAGATGKFVAFLDHDDELTPSALAAMAAAVAPDDVDFAYSDEDKIDNGGERFDPLFKPEWSPDLLLSFAYTCHLSVFRRSLVEQLGGFRSEFDGSDDWDLALRVSEKARRIVHVPEVLYHWRNLPGSAASDSGGQLAKPWAYEAGRRAVADALERRGEPGEVTMLEGFPGRYHVRRAITSSPLVSVIIPFRDEPAMLAACVRTLRADPGYENYELVLVDNDSALPETAALLEELGAEDRVRILPSPGPFNWAAINNGAARTCSGELLLFLNNDIEAHTPGWLNAMVGHAVRSEVGGVGARLLYPDGSIQHAGVVIGLGGIAGHVLRGLPGDVPGYNSMAIQTRDCSVVTGAALMVRRDLFLEVGGFDEELAVAFNDVDFCLKLRSRGYLVVYEPLAELIHHESKSRGHTDDFVESRRMIDRWGDVLVVGDPYMNVHLSHWRYWCPLSTAQEDDRWKNYLETRVLTPDSSSSG